MLLAPKNPENQLSCCSLFDSDGKGMREHLSRRSSVLAFSNEVAVLLNDESGGGDGNG